LNSPIAFKTTSPITIIKYITLPGKAPTTDMKYPLKNVARAWKTLM
jgi:hypothetical protein